MKRLGKRHLRPMCLLMILLAFLTLPLLASQVGEAGNGKKLLNNAVIIAGTALVAKITCQVYAPKPVMRVPAMYDKIKPIVQ